MNSKKRIKVLKFLISLFAVFIFNSLCYAQLEQWKYEMPVTITNNSASNLSNYQVLIKLNTLVLVNAGYMRQDGRDIRFASYCGSGLIDYCLENYMNTDSTKIWVKISSLAPYTSTTIFLFMGNPAAAPGSNLSLFEGPYSSTNNVTVNNTNTYSNCQRGFRFSPDRDIFVTHFGKRIPNATPRYVTLFDFNSQEILAQMQVSGGTPGAYNYNQLTHPKWLKSGKKYIIELFSGQNDNYYFGVSSQVGPYITYYDMRYANNCTQNTFPTNSVPGMHYGVPDFQYYVRQIPVNPEPAYTFGGIADTNTPAPPSNLFATAGNQQAFLVWNKNLELDIEKYFVYMNTADNIYTAAQIGFTNHPDTTYTISGLSSNTQYYFWVKAGDRYCSPNISGFSNMAYVGPVSVQNQEQLPEKFELYQNFPNPFNPATYITFDIPKETLVKLVIYDILGKEAEIVIYETKKAGTYSFKWNPVDFPSGVYIYKLSAGEFTKTMKMVLLK